METAKYIYIQLSEEVHNDKARILSASENQSNVLYLDSLTTEEMNLINQVISLIDSRLNQTNQVV